MPNFRKNYRLAQRPFILFFLPFLLLYFAYCKKNKPGRPFPDLIVLCDIAIIFLHLFCFVPHLSTKRSAILQDGTSFCLFSGNNSYFPAVLSIFPFFKAYNSTHCKSYYNTIFCMTKLVFYISIICRFLLYYHSPLSVFVDILPWRLILLFCFCFQLYIFF